jgi:hypothetical protein
VTAETLDATARAAALYRYAQAHDKFAELEQACVYRECPHMASIAHALALIALRAWLAEQDDPEPA